MSPDRETPIEEFYRLALTKPLSRAGFLMQQIGVNDLLKKCPELMEDPDVLEIMLRRDILIEMIALGKVEFKPRSAKNTKSESPGE